METSRKTGCRDCGGTGIETPPPPSLMDVLRDLAKRARALAAAPDYDEDAIRDALWALVDAVLEGEGR
jgi:hypothetical protein